jgi:hypothetical protein
MCRNQSGRERAAGQGECRGLVVPEGPSTKDGPRFKVITVTLSHALTNAGFRPVFAGARLALLSMANILLVVIAPLHLSS